MKKLKKFISVVLICAFAMTLFAGCSGSGNSDGGEDQMKIGISMSDMTHTTFIEMMDAIREEAKDKNVEIMEHSSDSDSGKLVEGLENFISAGCDAIIFQNFDPKAVESTIQDAKEKGIVVVAYDSYLEEADYVFEANNEDTGRAIGNMVGKWINENLDGEGKVAICDYSTIDFLMTRADYIEKGILETAPDSEIVVRQSAAYRDEGVEYGEAILQAHPEVNAVAGIVDGGVLGVKEAFEAAGKDGENIGMFGCDATEEGIAAIKEGGLFKGTISMDLTSVGVDMLDAAIDAVNGEFRDETHISFPITEVTADNVSDYE
ncbi:MAG TPA: sugar ABC transporter substrate-binding protein [Sellimonas intestinalis]|nr:sugar ABC transporter substrate-binding protein [Sellimonas intestinalis]